MQKPRFFPRFIWVVAALLAVLSVALTPLITPSFAHAAGSNKITFDMKALYGVRPVWNEAKPVGGGGSGHIPPCLDSAVLPRCFSPQQIRNAYGVQPFIDAGITGKGHTIVLIDGSSSPSIAADLHLYDLLYGLKDPKLTVLAPFGMPPFDPNAYVETALDMEIAHAIAPDANITVVIGNLTNAFSPQDFVAGLLEATNYAIDHNLGDVISQSFGVGESCVDSNYLQAEQAVFDKARKKGITVLASAGDFGALAITCSGKDITLAKGVSVPGSDPLVTSVGGTTLDATLKGGKYVSEITWNEGGVFGQGATGGGFSTVFPRPSYQAKVPGITNTRGLPDIAFDADPSTGVPVVVSVFGATYIIPVGGTSVGSPAWAGMVVLLNQFAGKRLGFLNDSLYRIGLSHSASKAFHDVTVGNNTVDFFDDKGNPVTIQGYDAGSGWDAVTGFGSPKLNTLASLLSHRGD